NLWAGDLKPYKGESKPPPLSLPDLSGTIQTLDSFKGKVVLINFWATWCPPCRIEMPSMWRLKNKFRDKPFEVIAVDMGEEKITITTFMPDKMERDFVVLMDMKGKALKDWKIFAFPTSFLIDKKGKIRYALYGAFEWDGPEPVKVVQMLLNEE
ncbi:MAG: TlpA disulfide reductase family protein, partial [Acidiferrobacterales bacterium]